MMNGKLSFKMEEKKITHTVRTVPKSNRKIVDKINTPNIIKHNIGL
jgi:hypothetical protein